MRWCSECHATRRVGNSASRYSPTSSLHFLCAVVLVAMSASLVAAQSGSDTSSIGFVVTSSGGVDVVFERPIQPAITAKGNDALLKQKSRAQQVAYIGAAVAGMLTLAFIVLVTRLCTIHSLSRRETLNAGKVYTRADSSPASRDSSDPAAIEEAIARIDATESYVTDEAITVVPVCPLDSTPAHGGLNGHAGLSATPSFTGSARPKVIRIHSEFEEMESDEVVPPVPKKKAGASKLKVQKTKSAK